MSRPFARPLAYAGIFLAFILLAVIGWWLASPSGTIAPEPIVPGQGGQPVTPTPEHPGIIAEAPLVIRTPAERFMFRRGASAVAYSPDTEQWLVLQNDSIPAPPTTTPVVPPPAATPSDTVFLYAGDATLRKTVVGPTHQDDQHITCAAFVPGGKQAVIGGPAGTLRVYNLDDSSLAWELPTKLPIQSLTFSPDGKILAFISGTTIALVDFEKHELASTLPGPSAAFTALAFVGNAKLLTGSADRVLRLWDLSSHTALRTFEAHTQPITALAVNTDGTLAVSGGGDARIILWNLSDGSIKWRYRGPQDFPYGASGAITSAAFLKDGSRLLTTTGESATLWDVETHQPLVAYTLSHMGGAFMISGERAFRTAENVWPIPDADPVPDALGPAEPPSRGSQLKVFQVQTPGPNAAPFGMARPLALMENATEVLLTSGGAYNSFPSFLRVNLQTGESSHEVKFETAIYFGGMYDLSADGTLAALISRNDVLLADASTGKLLRTCNIDPTPNTPLEAAALSPDGKFVAGAQTPYSHEGKPAIRIFNTSDGSLLRTLEGATDRIRAMAISPDDKLLVAAGGSTEMGPNSTPRGVSALSLPVLQRCDVRVWDVATGKLLHTLKGHIRMVTLIEMSADGKRALTAAEFGDTPILWDLDAGKEILQLHPHINRGRAANVTALALSPNGQYAATGGEDCDIRVYDLKSTSPAPPLPNPVDPANPVPSPYPPELARFELHRGAITSLRFLPDNKTLLSTSADGTLRLWQLP